MRKVKGQLSMLCKHCKKNQATIIYKGTVNGSEVDFCLCAACYNDMFGPLNSQATQDAYAGLLQTEPRPRKTQCPVCGMKYAEFERTGLLGCPACYDIFKEDLLPYIERIQGKTEHVGKVGCNDGEQDLTRKLKELQTSLEQAWRNGRRDEVQSIYAQIEQLKKRMTEEGGE